MEFRLRDRQLPLHSHRIALPYATNTKTDPNPHLYADGDLSTFVWAGNVHATAEPTRQCFENISSKLSKNTARINTKNKQSSTRPRTRQMVHEMYANFIASDFRCSRHSGVGLPVSILWRSCILARTYI